MAVAVASRVTDARTQQLKDLVEVIVKIVEKSAGGTISQRDAMRQAASTTGVSVSEMPYIVNSAVADHRISADLRSGKLALVG